MKPNILARLSGKYKYFRQKLRGLIRRTSCRYISYGVAVFFIRRMIDNPLGIRIAQRRSSEFLRALETTGIVFDPRDVVIRATMLKRLFPWAYCRFIKCPTEELENWVHICGFDAVKPWLDGSSGILVIACHFGPGHVAKYALGARGYVINNLRANNRFVRTYRVSPEHDCRMSRELYIRDDSSSGFLRTTVTIRELLRRGEIVTYAVDGKQGHGDGVQVTLLGEQHVIRTALPLVAALTSAKIVPMFATLGIDGRITIRFGDPYRDRREDEPPLVYAEMIVRDYMEQVQAFCESEPSHITLKRLQMG